MKPLEMICGEIDKSDKKKLQLSFEKQELQLYIKSLLLMPKVFLRLELGILIYHSFTLLASIFKKINNKIVNPHKPEPP